MDDRCITLPFPLRIREMDESEVRSYKLRVISQCRRNPKKFRAFIQGFSKDSRSIDLKSLEYASALLKVHKVPQREGGTRVIPSCRACINTLTFSQDIYNLEMLNDMRSILLYRTL